VKHAACQAMLAVESCRQRFRVVCGAGEGLPRLFFFFLAYFAEGDVPCERYRHLSCRYFNCWRGTPPGRSAQDGRVFSYAHAVERQRQTNVLPRRVQTGREACRRSARAAPARSRACEIAKTARRGVEWGKVESAYGGGVGQVGMEVCSAGCGCGVWCGVWGRCLCPEGPPVRVNPRVPKCNITILSAPPARSVTATLLTAASNRAVVCRPASLLPARSRVCSSFVQRCSQHCCCQPFRCVVRSNVPEWSHARRPRWGRVREK